MPLVTIIRDAGYVDRLRAYQVMIDGQTVGELKNGENKQLTTEVWVWAGFNFIRRVQAQTRQNKSPPPRAFIFSV